MLKNTNGLSFGWTGVLLGAAFVFVPACGNTGDNGGACTPNQAISCACPGGGEGVQTCDKDGQEYGTCDCGSAGAGGGGGIGGQGGGMTQQGNCGDGVEDAGECEEAGEFYCAEDCKGTGGTGGGTTTTTNTCEGAISYAGLVPNVASAWGQHPEANGKTGYDAGVAICGTLGADHPCSYDEVLKAEAAGELKNIAQGTTAWIHRVTPEMVGGVMVEGGPGGRCNDWTYTTNHISDGEFTTFDQVGIPTYRLDNDTFYDGVDTTHTIPNDLQCGGIMRALLCCFPACVN